MATSEPSAATGEAKDKLGKSRAFLFTLYQYDRHLLALRNEATKATYAVWGYEICPDTNRPHLQGYIHYENQHSLGKFSKTFNNCFVQRPNGTPRQNREYCLKIRPSDKKPNDKFEEFGELPVQGERTDWKAAVEALKGGSDVTAVVEDQPQLLPALRALERYKALTLKPKHRDVHVYVLIGGAGSGKTRWAYEHYPELYSKPRGDWWDGYTGQTAILLDDYYGYLPYCELLRVLDRYPYQVPVKGGFVQAQWDTVIITSNATPQHWYKGYGLTPALRRRLKTCFSVEVIDGESVYEEEANCWEAQGGDAS